MMMLMTMKYYTKLHVYSQGTSVVYVIIVFCVQCSILFRINILSPFPHIKKNFQKLKRNGTKQNILFSGTFLFLPGKHFVLKRTVVGECYNSV